MVTKPFSFRIEAKLRSRLEKEAKRTKRSSGQVINRAVQAYLGELDDLRHEIDEAFAEADKGVFISGKAVHQWIQSLDTPNELPFPEPDIVTTPKKSRKAA